MSLLFTIVRAAHANGTHHKLALDALTELQCPEAEAWRRLFLKNAELYLTASKLPDNEFKDFKNHVLHVRENYWGGAPERAQHWYGELVENLKCARWTDAVRDAGILSHYLVDPFQPLHTGQCDAENAVHRPIEWSISRSYDALRASAPPVVDDAALKAATGPNWLAQGICAGAEAANRHYESLMAHYDLRKGVVDPPAGLDANARRFTGILIRQATAFNAHVLDRAFLEANITPPNVPLTAETVLAALKIPRKMLEKRISNATERAAVEAMYHELMTTGVVDKTLDEENRVITDVHQAEVLAKAPPRPEVGKLFPVPARKAREPRSIAAVPAVKRTSSAMQRIVGPRHRPHIDAADAAQVPGRTERVAMPATRASHRLTETSPLVDAHSIGPKTAQRFAEVGIDTVGQFLTADASMLAAALNVRHIKADDIRVWQDQARLGCDVPGLSGGATQMLIAAGCRGRDALAAANPANLHAAIAAWHASPAAREKFRLADLPSLEKVAGWVDNARQAGAERKSA